MAVYCSYNKMVLGYRDMFALSSTALAEFINGIQQDNLETHKAKHRLSAQEHEDEAYQQTHESVQPAVPSTSRTSIWPIRPAQPVMPIFM